MIEKCLCHKELQYQSPVVNLVPAITSSPNFNRWQGKVHGRLNASWKISCLAVNGQSFLVIDGYLLKFESYGTSLLDSRINRQELMIQQRSKGKK